MPLCADSKLYYERYCPYSLIDGELASSNDADDSCAIDQQSSDTDQIILTDDSKSLTPLSHIYRSISKFICHISLSYLSTYMILSVDSADAL